MMFLALIRKQLKVLWRHPQELVILLLMPIGLITILSFALGSLIDGDSSPINVKVAIVQHEDEQQELVTILQESHGEKWADVHSRESLKQMLPISRLLQLLEQEEMQQFITVSQIESSDLDALKKEGEYDVILEVPAGFTKQFYTSFFAKGEIPALHVYLNEQKEIASTITQNILESFQYQYTLMAELSSKGLLTQDVKLPTADFSSTVKTVNQQEPVSTSVYYTFSMTVMFILYIAGTLSSQAFLEKHMHIFDRILLANINPMIYLLSVIVSTVILSFIQVSIIFGVVYLMLDISFVQLPLHLLVTLMLAIVVGSIAALLSAANYRFNSAEFSNLFSSVFVSILALFGGSFFNVSSFAPTLAKIGSWTPNGAALQSYLTIQQGGGLGQISSYLWILMAVAVICTTIAFLLFPKRGGIA
ncbi:ABC transporter permease [Lysinibacillus sp. CNPSo 3705]|uniref:ABC transporter permease n=1 Tax=Lysinibacillus sp. CNPSo 3705 TaxID=3028148 RepID=UPI00104E40BB|nr:ABC transporter permease [Lysinibacillus sp. CNPSo 3705]MDD1503705.1 ABC transporter permease [Lysinibacillus sp. CNPSo 3705]